MNTRKLLHFITATIALIVATMVVTPSVHAQNLNQIKVNMEKRLPQIDKLKEQGALGENNQGYLEVREAKDNAAAIASVENTDRKTVYEAIAKQQKTTAEAVGKARARQIAQSSKPGVWIQDEKGGWKKK